MELREEQGLCLADDLPAGAVRAYRIAVAADVASGRTFELFARSGGDAERMIATVGMPPDLTPPELSFGTKALILPPLFVLDATLVAGTLVVLPFAAPFLWAKCGPEPVDDS